MITLSAKVDLASGGEISNVTQNNLSNISSTAPINSKKPVRSAFQIGLSKLGEGFSLYDKLPYFLGKEISDANGDFATPYTIVVSGSEISSIEICFDEKNKRHPRIITVDGKDFFDDDAIFSVGVNIASTHTIKIDNWNTPNDTLVITSISAGISIDIDHRKILSLDFSNNERADFTMPSWGVYSNSGKLSFVDYDGNVLDLINGGLLKPNQKISIEIKNTIKKSSEFLGEFFSKEWSYDNDNRTVSVSFDDGLTKMQDLKFRYRTISKIAMSKFYEDLAEYSRSSGFDFEQIENLGDREKTFLYIECPYPVTPEMSLWEHWDWLCNVCQFVCYKSKNGKIKVVRTVN